MLILLLCILIVLELVTFPRFWIEEHNPVLASRRSFLEPLPANQILIPSIAIIVDRFPPGERLP